MELAIIAIVAVVCIVGGWSSLYHFSNGLLIAGVVTLAIGVLGLFGGWGVTRSFSYRYAATASLDSPEETARRAQHDVEQGFGLTVEMTIAGLLSCVLGTWIQMSLT
jgi:hypothetical protein